MSNTRYVIPDLDDDDDGGRDEQSSKSKESRSYFSKRVKIDHPTCTTETETNASIATSTTTTNQIEIPPVDQQSNATSMDPSATAAPVLPSVPYSSSLLVHSRQRGNPLLKYFRQVKWEYSDLILGGADYSMSRSSCALYLSLRYHTLNPNYIYERLKTSKFPYQLKILLCQCDIGEPSQALKELARLCLIYELTLLVSWNDEESAKYLETYKIMEGKSAENLLDTQQYQSNDYLTKYIDSITQVKSINKSDAQTLLHAFGSFESILNATNDQLNVCPGLGKLKAQRLYQTFNQSFVRKKSSQTQKSLSFGMKKNSSEKAKRSEDLDEDFLDLSNIDEEI